MDSGATDPPARTDPAPVSEEMQQLYPVHKKPPRVKRDSTKCIPLNPSTLDDYFSSLSPGYYQLGGSSTACILYLIMRRLRRWQLFHKAANLDQMQIPEQACKPPGYCEVLLQLGFREVQDNKGYAPLHAAWCLPPEDKLSRTDGTRSISREDAVFLLVNAYSKAMTERFQLPLGAGISSPADDSDASKDGRIVRTFKRKKKQRDRKKRGAKRRAAAAPREPTLPSSAAAAATLCIQPVADWLLRVGRLVVSRRVSGRLPVVRRPLRLLRCILKERVAGGLPVTSCFPPLARYPDGLSSVNPVDILVALFFSEHPRCSSVAQLSNSSAAADTASSAPTTRNAVATAPGLLSARCSGICDMSSYTVPSVARLSRTLFAALGLHKVVKRLDRAVDKASVTRPRAAALQAAAVWHLCHHRVSTTDCLKTALDASLLPNAKPLVEVFLADGADTEGSEGDAEDPSDDATVRRDDDAPGGDGEELPDPSAETNDRELDIQTFHNAVSSVLRCPASQRFFSHMQSVMEDCSVQLVRQRPEDSDAQHSSTEFFDVRDSDDDYDTESESGSSDASCGDSEVSSSDSGSESGGDGARPAVLVDPPEGSSQQPTPHRGGPKEPKHAARQLYWTVQRTRHTAMSRAVYFITEVGRLGNGDKRLSSLPFVDQQHVLKCSQSMFMELANVDVKTAFGMPTGVRHLASSEVETVLTNDPRFDAVVLKAIRLGRPIEVRLPCAQPLNIDYRNYSKVHESIKLVPIRGRGMGMVTSDLLPQYTLFCVEHGIVLYDQNTLAASAYVAMRPDLIDDPSSCDFRKEKWPRFPMAQSHVPDGWLGPYPEPYSPFTNIPLERWNSARRAVSANAFHSSNDRCVLRWILPTLAKLNHSCRPNCCYWLDEDRGVAWAFTLQDIQPGSELTLSYAKCGSYDPTAAFDCGCRSTQRQAKKIEIDAMTTAQGLCDRTKSDRLRFRSSGAMKASSFGDAREAALATSNVQFLNQLSTEAGLPAMIYLRDDQPKDL